MTISASPVFNELLDVILAQQRLTYGSNISYKDYAKIINRIANTLHSTLVSAYFTSPMGLGMNNDIMKKMFYGKNSLANVLYDIKIRKSKFKHLIDNPLIQVLDPVISEDEVRPSYISVLTYSKLDKWSKDSISRGWQEMFTDNSEESEAVRRLAVNLMVYSYVTSGFKMGLNSFYQFMPIDALKYVPEHIKTLTEGEAVSYNDFVKELRRHMNDDSGGMERVANYVLREMYVNHWNDDSLVPPIKEPLASFNLIRRASETTYPAVFTAVKEAPGLFYGVNHRGDPLFAPFIKYVHSRSGLTLLAEFVGVRYLDGKRPVPVYKTISKKSYFATGVRVFEVGTDTIFDFNKVPKEIAYENELKISNLKGYEGFIHIPIQDRIPNLSDARIEKDYEDVFEEAEIVEDVKALPGPETVVKPEGTVAFGRYEGELGAFGVFIDKDGVIIGGAPRAKRFIGRKVSDIPQITTDEGYEQRIGGAAEEQARIKELLRELNRKDITPEEIEKANAELTSLYFKEPGERVTFEEKAEISFNKWFEGSKIVNEDGSPMVVYHGTDTKFDVFDESLLSKVTGDDVSKAGFHFTDSKSVAENYAIPSVLKSGKDKVIIEAYLSIKNPKHMKDMSELRGKVGAWKNVGEVVAKLKEEGYDGIVIESYQGAKDIIAFSSDQIRIVKEKAEISRAARGLMTKGTLTNNLREAKVMNTKKFRGYDNWISLGQKRDKLAASKAYIARMNRKYERYGKLINLVPKADSWLIEFDQNVIDAINSSEQRITGEPSKRGEMFAEQREVLQKTFPGVEIIEDPTLPVPGRLMANGKTIKVNPLYWTSDTLGHEYGHLLIDLIGGVNNILVKQGISFLEGSDLQKKVYEAYPDLIARGEINRVKKEVLAQALGLETAQIFKEEFEMSRWERWLVRFFRRVRQLLGLESGAIRKLAKRLVKGVPLTPEEAHASAPNYDQDQRIPKDDEDIFRLEEEEPVQAEKIRLDAIEALEKKIGIYRQRGKPATIETLQKALKDIEQADNPLRAVIEFVKLAERQTNGVIVEFQKAEREERMGTGEGFSADRLFRWKDYLSAYGHILDDVKDALIAYKNAPIIEGDVHRPIRDKRIQERIDRVNSILNNKALIEQQFRSRGVDILAKFLAPHSERIAIEYKDRLERRYNKLSKEEKAKMSVEEYQAKYLKLDEAKIRQATEQMLRRELVKAEWDINLLGRWLDNILDSPDPVVSAMRNAFMKQDTESRWESFRKRNEIVAVQKRLEKALGAHMLTDQRKFYGFMLEVDAQGKQTQHIVSPYLSAMFDEYEELGREWEADPSKSAEEVVQLKRDWRNKNMPRTQADKKAWNRARHAFMDQMKKDGLINETEYSRIDAYEVNLGTRDFKPLNELISNENAAEKYLSFRRENSWNYRTPIAKWKSSQWHSLMKIAGVDTKLTITEQEEALRKYEGKDPRIEFYNLIKNTIDEAHGNLPLRFRLRTRLPGIVKEFGERVREGQNWLTVAKESTKIGLTRRPEDVEKGQYELTTEAGDPVNFIPVFYTNRIEEQNQSYDLASIYHAYWSMAKEYALKAEILPEMEMARLFVEEREVMKRDAKGNVIRDALSRKGERILTKKGVNSFIALQFKDWFEAEVYGQREKYEGALFGKIDIAKAANLLNKYTAFNLLGVNMVQGFANVLLGQTLQWIEAMGGQHYGVKDFAKAGAYYFKNLPGILGDVGERVPTNIVTLMNETFDTLNEYEGGKFRKNSKFQQLMTSNTLFFTTHAGEHYMQTRVMLAMLNRMKALDKNGKVIGTMLENLEVRNGELAAKKDVANFGPEQMKKFGYMVKRVLAHIHGEYSQMGKNAIQRYAMGRMGMLFRKFVVPGFKRRWGKRKVNELLGDYTEGNYITTGRFVRRLFKDFKTFQLGVFSESWNDLTRMEKANIRRTLGEMIFLIGTWIMIKALMGAMEDDDEDEWYMSFLAYQAVRLKTELLFFSPSLVEPLRILRSPAATMSVVENTIRLFSQLLSDPFEIYERGNWKGKPKITKHMINFVPAWRQVYRLKYVDDQINWFYKN